MTGNGKDSLLARAVEGLVLVLGGVLAIWDGLRVTREMREISSFDAIGPDRYLMGVGVLLIVAGVLYLIFAPPPEPPDTPADAPRPLGLPMWLVLTALMLGYAGAILAAGYAVATALYFVLALRVMGIESWRRTIVPAIVAAAVYWLLFARLADMSLPKGLLWPE